jgi:hypothetical protein
MGARIDVEDATCLSPLRVALREEDQDMFRYKDYSVHNFIIKWAHEKGIPLPDLSQPPLNVVEGAALRCMYCNKEETYHEEDRPGGLKLQTCSRCQHVHYCSRGCQRSDWKRPAPEGHKIQCISN